MNLDSLKKEISQRKVKPIYLLHGEEPFFLEQAEALFEQGLLSEAERGFNLSILYGRDSDAQSITDAALRYPMFADFQLIIVREAQSLRDIEKLLSYAEKPVPSTVLVLVHKHKKYPANRKLYKAIARSGVVMESKKVRDQEMAAWVDQFLRQQGYRIQPDAAQLVAEHLGNDLGRVVSELKKLMLNIEAKSSIKSEDIERYIGISREYNVFELQNALLKQDRARAWKITEHLGENIRQHPMVMIVGSLYNLYSKVYMAHFVQGASDKELAELLGVHPFFVKDYRLATSGWPIPKVERSMGVLMQYDLRTKGVEDAGTEHSSMLREMVWKLLN